MKSCLYAKSLSLLEKFNTNSDFEEGLLRRFRLTLRFWLPHFFALLVFKVWKPVEKINALCCFHCLRHCLDAHYFFGWPSQVVPPFHCLVVEFLDQVQGQKGPKNSLLLHPTLFLRSHSPGQQLLCGMLRPPYLEVSNSEITASNRHTEGHSQDEILISPIGKKFIYIYIMYMVPPNNFRQMLLKVCRICPIYSSKVIFGYFPCPFNSVCCTHSNFARLKISIRLFES